VRGREAILERRDGTRVPIVPYPTPLRDRTGAVVGVVNMTVDISQRKQAERALAERNFQLGLAGQFALVGTYAYDVGSERYQVSPGYAAIHGLPEGTEETSRAEWRTRVHPSDLPAVEAGFEQASLIGGANTIASIVLSVPMARFDGSIRATSYPMTTMDQRHASSVRTSTSRSARRRRLHSRSTRPAWRMLCWPAK